MRQMETASHIMMVMMIITIMIAITFLKSMYLD